jgi:hypothetical protein
LHGRPPSSRPRHFSCCPGPSGLRSTGRVLLDPGDVFCDPACRRAYGNSKISASVRRGAQTRWRGRSATCFLMPVQGGGGIGGHAARKICTSSPETCCEPSLDPIQEVHVFRHSCRRRVQAKWWGRSATCFLMPTQGGGGIRGHVAWEIRISSLEIGCELNLDPIQEWQGSPEAVPTRTMP